LRWSWWQRLYQAPRPCLPLSTASRAPVIEPIGHAERMWGSGGGRRNPLIAVLSLVRMQV
jgi:hypothetical protein